MVVHPRGGRIELALIGSKRCRIGRSSGGFGLGSVVTVEHCDAAHQHEGAGHK
jgi:hypothetical protein